MTDAAVPDRPTKFEAAMARIATLATLFNAAKSAQGRFRTMTLEAIFHEFGLAPEPLRWAPQILHNPLAEDIELSVCYCPRGASDQITLLAVGAVLESFWIEDATEPTMAFVMSLPQDEAAQTHIVFLKR